MAATRHFVWHLGEMFLAMVVGMAALDPFVHGILAMGGTSYADLVDSAPTAVALILMLNMTVPMLLWMRVGEHEPTEISEMGVAMAVVGATTVFLPWRAVIDAAAICGIECGLMIPGMVAAMLLHPWMRARRSLTSGGVAPQSPAGIATGPGTDVAVETADVVLMRSGPARRRDRHQNQTGHRAQDAPNLARAVGYNTLALPGAAGVSSRSGSCSVPRSARSPWPGPASSWRSTRSP